MQFQVFSAGSLQRFLLLGLFIMNASLQASAAQNDTASRASELAMGNVEYELPHELGVLTMQLPLHWVGGRADGVEALWIDQDGSPFKDNVTLTIRDGSKVANSDKLLDRMITAMVQGVEPSTVSSVEKTQGRRMVSFERTVGGQEIIQTSLTIYAESAEKSYLLTLNHSRPLDADPIDLREVSIK